MGTMAHNTGLARLRFKHWRISTKISVIMVALTVLPLLIFNLITSERLAVTLLNRVSGTLAGSAQSAVRVQAFDMSILAQEIANPATLKALRNALRTPTAPLSSQAEEAFFRLTTFTYPPHDAFLVDTNARVLTSFSGQLNGQRLPNDANIKAALAGQSGVLGIEFKGTWRDPHMVLALPIRESESGPILGAVITSYDLGRVDFLTNETLKIGQESVQANEPINLFTISAEGMILSRPVDNTPPRFAFVGQAADRTLRATYAQPGALGQVCPTEYRPETGECRRESGELRAFSERLDYQPVWEAAQQVIQTGQSRSLRYCRPANPDQHGTVDGPCAGQWMLAALAPIRVEAFGPLGEMVAVAELPEAVVLARVVEARNQGLAIAGLVGLAAAGIALLFGRTLSNPIKRLSRAALKVEEGAPLDTATVNAVAANGDEIGDLARVFGAAVEALRGRNEELRTIYEIGTTISSSIELDKTLEYIVLTLRSVIPYDWAEICLYDAAKNEMHVQVCADHDSVEPTHTAPYPADQGYLGLLITRSAGLLVPDVTTSTKGDLGAGRTWGGVRPQAYLGVPLRVKDQVVGAVEMIAKMPDAFHEHHLRLLESVAVQAAVALQNAREIQAREAALKQQIQELKIVIDEGKRKTDVAAITESSYFQELQSKVGQLRQRKARKAGE